MNDSVGAIRHPTARPSGSPRAFLIPACDSIGALWRHRLAGAAFGVVLAVVSGVAIAALMPRGPVTTGQAIGVILVGFGLGFVAGGAMQSRWAILLAPAVQLAAFEVARAGTPGPTVSAIHLDSVFGILAFISGRGSYALLALAPIMLGAAYGAALVRRFRAPADPVRQHARTKPHYVRRGTTWLLTAGMLGLVALIAIPASTPPILGPDGKALAGSVTALQKVSVGGHDEWLMIHGYNAKNPVLLYLSGGPGQSDIAFARGLYDNLSKVVTFVAFDQRGTGKSYASLDPTTLTLDRAVADVTEVTNYLRQRFQQQKIYVIGESWGTVLGVLAVQRHPELYYAYLGSGQMVDLLETDTRINHDVLAAAEKSGDSALAAKVKSLGAPPYKDPMAYAYMMQQYPLIETSYESPAAFEAMASKVPAGMSPFPGILGSEYNLMDKIGDVRGLIDMFATMYPQLQGIDFRKTATNLQVPIYLLEGKHELAGRLDLAVEWYGQLQAPTKQLYMFEDAGHSVMMEELQPLQSMMTDTVLPQSYPGR